MTSNFLLIENDCVETSLTLIESGYSEKPDVFYDEEQSKPHKILINTIERSFFWLDEDALKDTKELVNTKYHQKLTITNLKDFTQWLQTNQ